MSSLFPRLLLVTLTALLLIEAPAATEETLDPAIGFRRGIEIFASAIYQHHPAPFVFHPRAEWEERVGGLMARADRLDEATLFVELCRIVGMTRDSHTYVWLDGESPLFRSAVPLRFWEFEDGVFIRATDAARRELLGSRLRSVNGVPIDEVWERLIASRPGETPMASRRSAAVLLRIPEYLTVLGVSGEPEKLRLELETRDGGRREVVVPALDETSFSDVWETSIGFKTPPDWIEPTAARTALWLARRETPYWAEHLESERALYVQVNRSSRYIDPEDPERDAWADFVARVEEDAQAHSPRRLIVDLRHNRGGDSSMWQLLAHAIVRMPTLDRPAGVQILISRLTESAAVVLATKLEQETRAVFVGEPTASRPNFYNDHRPWPERELYRIPGTAITLRVSRVIEQWSAPQDRRTMLLPDLPAPFSWNAFASGEDPALKAALRVTPEAARKIFVEPDGTSLTEPWSHPWRATQRPAWAPQR